MNEYKVSIIVGIYNSGLYLRKGLNSIMNQTWSDLEVILMDDGSGDDSKAICDEYAARDKRFVAIHKPNSGVCDSRNKGLEIATGDYVCFMDGDDWLAEDHIEYLMNIILDKDVKMSMSDNLFTTKDYSQIKNDVIEIRDCIHTIKTIIYPYMMLGPWNKMYSMEIIKKYNIRFPDHWFGETLHFANTVAYFSEKVGVGHRKIYYYRLDNSKSGTSQFNVHNRLLSLDNAKKLYNCCFSAEPSIRYAIDWHLYENYNILLMNIIATNSKREYHNEYLEALCYINNHWHGVFRNSELGFRRKIIILLEAIFPRFIAKIRIYKQNNR